MQTVWQFFRTNKLCNVVWNRYDTFVDARKKAWGVLICDPDRIRSSGSRGWACVNLWAGRHDLQRAAPMFGAARCKDKMGGPHDASQSRSRRR
jgi:hypothetical protein